MSGMSNTLPRLLTTYELMQVLNVSRSTIYSWVRRGVLPAPKRIGNAIRWDPIEVRRLIEAPGALVPSEDIAGSCGCQEALTSDTQSGPINSQEGQGGFVPCE